MLTLTIPAEVTARDAAVFTQSGDFVMTGHREKCELRAMAIGGLYCLFDSRTGRPYIKGDFERETIVVELVNPFSGTRVQHDITALTSEQMDAYAELMPDEIREEIHSQVAPCEPSEFLAAYVDRVGAEEAGRLILGS